MSPKKTNAKLSSGQLETLAAFCAGRITGSEARAELHCDRRSLIEFVAMQGLTLPRISQSQAVEMAQQALVVTGIPTKAKGGDLA